MLCNAHIAQVAMMACANNGKVVNRSALESEQDDDELLEHDTVHGGQNRVRNPTSVWDARKKSNRCGVPGYRVKDCNTDF